MFIENNETFLSEMTKLFQKNQSKSIYITMKRLDTFVKKKEKNVQSDHSSQSVPSENKCLIRVHTYDKKISTTVSYKDVNKFQLAYANLLKGNLYGLKKRDNKKKSGVKAKATQ